MLCPSCGKIIVDDSVFCSYCGVPVRKKASASAPVNAGNQPHDYNLEPASPLKLQLIPVKGGMFRVGDELSGIREAVVSDFFISNIPVTQQIYEFVAGLNPSKMKDSNKPVESVSWYDAVIFCNKLSLCYNKKPCYSINGYFDFNVLKNDSSEWNSLSCDFTADGFRLPSECEWEYAARGGIYNSPFVYSGSDDINDVAWYGENSGITTHVSGGKRANALGIYDMSGNVEEWCWDWFAPYGSGRMTNYRGPVSGSLKVKRGGSWLDDDVQCTVSFRGSSSPKGKGSNLGFRICTSK